MKILWLKGSLLHPVNSGGRIVSYQLLTRLRRNHTIHYVSYLGSDQDGCRVEEYCTQAWTVAPARPPRNLRPYALRVACEWLSRLPAEVSTLSSRTMRSLVRNLVEREKYDIIVADSVQIAPNLPDVSKCVLFQSNVESMILRRMADAETDTLLRAHWRIQERWMFSVERRICRRAAHVIAISPADAALLKSTYGLGRLSAINIGVDAGYFNPPADPEPKSDLVFTGSQSWWPNVDGILWFAREVLPLIRARRPECRLSIVGNSPMSEILALAKADPLIEVTGTVPDIRPWLWRSAVAIVPLRAGSGVRIKIYEAMAAGIPVVATTIGAEGLDVHPPRDIRIADTAEEFARACLKLLESPAERRRMAAEAMEKVCQRHTWDHTAREFERILHALNSVQGDEHFPTGVGSAVA